jgi:hypothetical protein
MRTHTGGGRGCDKAAELKVGGQVGGVFKIYSLLTTLSRSNCYYLIYGPYPHAYRTERYLLNYEQSFKGILSTINNVLFKLCIVW